MSETAIVVCLVLVIGLEIGQTWVSLLMRRDLRLREEALERLRAKYMEERKPLVDPDAE